MSASVNKVIIIMTLGRDPETRYATSGSAICNLSGANERTWKDRKTGEKQSEVEWHRVVLYDRLAEIAGEYLKKGSSCFVEGRLRTRKWQDKDGIDRYTTEIIAESLQLLGSRQEGPYATRAQQSQPNQYEQQSGGRAALSGSGFDDMDDDIPF